MDGFESGSIYVNTIIRVLYLEGTTLFYAYQEIAEME